ncbi:tRNA pseudouridine(55) synthase TruB [Mycoplasmopsis arginini]|uniref:tRNA pseudouridine(55) synthase n=1 Tax=Mycoplasmopsis arginini TaxID=2094 RepID=A0ABZ2AL96_MYCAR|nr:tRNA pseudouridine(55) synthase TruB [Mycoplasmopsis arginini]WVN22280.1 tRNA pseudouridine(55) synthase TruB [Mycoplasmopsis arginini]VEU81690.1 tRNA pseudouridine synthase B [Mycoplasmopsis arginini]
MFFKINKKRGESSFFAIKKFAKLNNIKKIGHSGTLDPLADGLLIVATDEDTKTLSYLVNDTKEYYVKATLHCTSRSYDEGEEVIYLDNKTKVTKEQIEDVLKKIQKQTKQIPPIFSAKKINGQRSYDLARKNIEVTLKECEIKIYELTLKEFNFETQTFAIYAKVSKGTYIRSLIHDIGLMLNTDAVVNILRRCAIGKIKLNDSLEYEKIVDIKSLFNVELYTLNDFEVKLIKSKVLYLERLKNINNKGIFIYKNQIIGCGIIKNGLINFNKVLFNRIFQNP